MNNELDFENSKPQVSFENTINDLDFQAPQNVVGGTTNYNALSNKPKINGVELVDDKTLEDLGIKQEYTASDIKFADGDTFQEKYNSGELKGEKGEKGEQGIQGPKGDTGAIGNTGPQGPKGDKGDTGATGPQGPKGDTGTSGTNGKDGKTPVKGTDYYTEADKQEMVNLVLEEIPTSEGVAELMTPVTYEELKTLRDNAELVAGMFYRITDYVTTSIQEATQSAGHQFDIIVRALDEKTLDEEAKAIQSENDEYFANSNLTGWQVWYTLDNDTSKYAWASENGKGVIYRLIDENGNDAPYDFKNIQMLDANNSEDTTYYYTFDSKGVDHSLNGSKCFNNEINKYIDGTQRVNRIIFKCNNAEVSTNFFDFECYNNTMGSCDHMKFGRECYGNVFGGLNHLCTFDTKFRNNVVGSETQSIQVGQGASNNNFANCIYYSTFGNYFRNNKVCEYTYYSSFGHYVQNFIMGKNADELGQCMRYLTIENGVTYVNLYKKDATTKKYMENIKICSGTNGTSSNRINIEVEELEQKYAIVYGNNSKGELKKYCVADFTDIPTYEDGDEVSY